MACSSNLLADLLLQSTLTPGHYQVSGALKSARLMAVCAGDTPLLLTGSADDANSQAQAKAFATSSLFAQLIEKLAIAGDLKAQAVAGSEVVWPSPCESIVASQAGVVEDNEAQGQLLMINPTPFKELTLMLCVIDELARIIDPKLPTLESGDLLARFIQGDQQTLQLQ